MLCCVMYLLSGMNKDVHPHLIFALLSELYSSLIHCILIIYNSNDRILKSIDKLVEKGKLTLDSANDAMGRIEFTTDMDALRDVDLVVEAVIENIDLKKDLYTSLGEICKPETIFASNTSSLSISGTYVI